MDSKVEKFIAKSKLWPEEIRKLRAIILSTKLDEEFKWNLPCYSYQGSNVVIIQPFKNYLGLMFFKGTLLKDPKKVLIANGPNSQAAKRLEFKSVSDVTKQSSIIKAYIKEAIALEKSGQKVEFKKKPTAIPDELKSMFTKNAKLKKAFESLTPGRQRAYIFHFAGAKQSTTRIARIEKYIPKILKGKGMMD
jgi:uncharacterized protein YdeI (YjbR/CyaY-like superfamily)